MARLRYGSGVVRAMTASGAWRNALSLLLLLFGRSCIRQLDGEIDGTSSRTTAGLGETAVVVV